MLNYVPVSELISAVFWDKVVSKKIYIEKWPLNKSDIYNNKPVSVLGTDTNLSNKKMCCSELI